MGKTWVKTAAVIGLATSSLFAGGATTNNNHSAAFLRSVARNATIENGVKMGRKEGFKLSDEEILAKYPKVASKLRKGLSVRDAAAACGVSPATVQKVKKAMR